MNKKRRRCGCLAVLLAAGLMTSCSRDNSKVEIIEGSGNNGEQLNFFSTSPYAGNDITKYWSDQFSDEYKKDLYVNYDSASYNADAGVSYRELLEKRLESSQPDDIYIINAEDVLEFDKKGYWMDLSDMNFVKNLKPAALYQSTYNDKVFSVPLSFTGFGFFWNVDMLKKYGLEIPHNLDEFKKVCAALKAEGITPYCANKGFGLTVPAMSAGLYDLYGDVHSEEVINDLNSGKLKISAYMEKGYSFLSMMIDEGWMDKEQAINTLPAAHMEEFLTGNYAFTCGSMSAMNQLDSAKFQVELTGLPVLADGVICVYGADSRLSINPNSNHLETSKKFLEMVGTPEALDKTASLSYTMSCAKDSKLKAPENQKEMWELLNQSGQIPNQDFKLHFNTWESIRDGGRLLCQGKSVKEVSAWLDEQQMSELRAYEQSVNK